MVVGENAKKIKNNVSKNVETKEVARLKDEIAILRRQLQVSGTPQAMAVGNSTSHNNNSISGFSSSSQVYGGSTTLNNEHHN